MQMTSKIHTVSRFMATITALTRDLRFSSIQLTYRPRSLNFEIQSFLIEFIDCFKQITAVTCARLPRALQAQSQKHFRWCRIERTCPVLRTVTGGNE